LGIINGQLGSWQEAVGCWHEAIAIQPENLDAHFNLGQGLIVLGRYEEALTHFQQILRSRPNDSAAYHGLGFALKQLFRLEEAAASFEQVLRLKPDLVEARNNLGMTYKDQGQLDLAIACFREALRAKPTYAEAHSNLLLAMLYSPALDPSAVFAEHRHWAEKHANVLLPLNTHPNTRDPDRRLRIGYVSPDLRTHSIAFFLAPLLVNHDPTAVEITCYANVSRPDAITGYFQTLAGKWRNIHSLPDEAVAKLIQEDAIDILVDLSGHTAHNRLLVFARRPAPVQVTYLGYPNTTGLSTIDYRFTDSWADPLGETDQWHTEELIRLPRGFLCYRSVDDAPPVAALPSLTTGQVTFGSFKILSKMTPEVVALWARILSAVPGSRLFLKNKSLHDIATAKHCRELFARHGIVGERLTLQGWQSGIGDHLNAYAHVDIALDTFPYNGTTTTCEALWMGVPVITLAGSLHAGRVGVSLLSQLELNDLIATDADGYVARAERWAKDLDGLSRLRADLRDRMANSSLCDGPAFARDVENAYRAIWRAWCKGCV
jgi:predicted O-linked N-acetylglucosamine transferase (SPINDLY family)